MIQQIKDLFNYLRASHVLKSDVDKILVVLKYKRCDLVSLTVNGQIVEECSYGILPHIVANHIAAYYLVNYSYNMSIVSKEYKFIEAVAKSRSSTTFRLIGTDIVFISEC